MLKCGFQKSIAKKSMIDKNLFKSRSAHLQYTEGLLQFVASPKDIFEDDIILEAIILEASQKYKDNLLGIITEYLFKTFDDQKIAIFYMYFYERLTYYKIAKIYGCSHVYIIKVIKKMLKKLIQHISELSKNDNI